MLPMLILCHQVVDAGAVVLLVMCVQEPELSLKRVAASALSDIAKHTPELAQAVVDAGMQLPKHHSSRPILTYPTNTCNVLPAKYCSVISSATLIMSHWTQCFS